MLLTCDSIGWRIQNHLLQKDRIIASSTPRNINGFFSTIDYSVLPDTNNEQIYINFNNLNLINLKVDKIITLPNIYFKCVFDDFEPIRVPFYISGTIFSMILKVDPTFKIQFRNYLILCKKLIVPVDIGDGRKFYFKYLLKNTKNSISNVMKKYKIPISYNETSLWQIVRIPDPNNNKSIDTQINYIDMYKPNKNPVFKYSIIDKSEVFAFNFTNIKDLKNIILESDVKQFSFNSSKKNSLICFFYKLPDSSNWVIYEDEFSKLFDLIKNSEKLTLRIMGKDGEIYKYIYNLKGFIEYYEEVKSLLEQGQ